ncbi:MAG TPA: response regulator transcription factor [bacterium]|jgi:DNA-binding response OmpR family regulator|nr:response regulator transcription factor [bacterium]
MKLLIIEDEPRIASFVEEGLQAEGFSTAVAADGEAGLRTAADPDVGLVILDIGLPKIDGLAVLATLRRTRPDLPVLMLTARSDVRSKVGGLNAGADDYLTKPFAFAELLARIRALLRRHVQQRELSAGGLVLDLRARSLHHGAHAIDLTSREFSLLEYLMRRANEVVSRADLLKHVWALEFEPGSTVLETTLTRLRRKLERAGAPVPIDSIRGTGYRFVA